MAELHTQHRLATYGTLRPGERNARQLASLRGKWMPGLVAGRMATHGWGPKHGFPAIILDEGARNVRVEVFTSADLPAHWDRLDAFEGPGYTRTPVNVETAAGSVRAFIYVLAE